MTAKIYHLPVRNPDLIPRPDGARMAFQGTAVEVDYREDTYQEYPLEDGAEDGEPSIYALGTDVVLNLGDCTPAARVELIFDPETALEWAKQLMNAAEQAAGASKT